MGIGRITASLTTLYNENSVALINNNFDFTLVKLEAPPEFSRLGSTISRKRRVDAEEGSLHKTARRLGALFGDVLPATDDLLRAYGTRVSEISDNPHINPRGGSSREGIFASHIGADTTSLWAAATSGSAAIAVHLLACMLARIFTGPEAISLWVELVKQQKQRINTGQDKHLYSHEHRSANAAAQQEISRTDLANWDSSARAWLLSADEARCFNHKQTMLILNNANMPVNNEPEPYKSVMKAWVVALEAMDNLVRGLPQRVQDGAALLAISSWHLYPDMLIYGDACVEVKQKDPIFSSTALLTLGLQDVREECKSVYWSLPLAHLQYYGHPVQASRAVSKENSRISYEQFAFIVLGCVFAGWKNYATTNNEGLAWLIRVAEILKLSNQNRFDHSHQPTWLIYVASAARDYDNLEQSEQEEARQLMKLGRRYSNFLNSDTGTTPPLFGLSQIPILISVLKNDQERVRCLRHLCVHLKLDTSNFFIRYRASVKEAWIEYASVCPMPRSTKRTATGQLKEPHDLREKHVRWIPLSHRHLLLISQSNKLMNNIEKAIERLEELQRIQRDEETAMVGLSIPESNNQRTIESRRRSHEIQDLKDIIAIGQRRSVIENIGEMFLPVIEFHREDIRHVGASLVFGHSTDFVQACGDLLKERENPLVKRTSIPQTFFLGDQTRAALYALNGLWLPQNIESIASSEFFKEFFTADVVDPEAIYRYLSASEKVVEISCLRACAMMAEIYHLLPGATISTLVVKMFLNQAKWIPQKTRNDHDPLSKALNLSQTFACIAMFESGTCNLDPSSLEEAFAMSSGNSMYIAGSLLCDPHEQPNSTEIRRVIGNLGRSGMTFLISPPEVKIREANPENWRIISHRDFDGLPENHFDQTSLHLSFTDYEHPLSSEDTPRHTIDRAVILLEALISIYEGGTWVGEVDILKGLSIQVHRMTSAIHCSNGTGTKHKGNVTYQEALKSSPHLAATSIENWDELIEAPQTGLIVIRAHQNWLARLAAAATCARLHLIPIILPRDVCWSCCAEVIHKDRFLPNRVALIF